MESYEEVFVRIEIHLFTDSAIWIFGHRHLSLDHLIFNDECSSLCHDVFLFKPDYSHMSGFYCRTCFKMGA